MEHVDLVVLLAFCAGMSYAVGWASAIAESVSGRYSPGLGMGLWAAGVAVVAGLVTVAVAWF